MTLPFVMDVVRMRLVKGNTFNELAVYLDMVKALGNRLNNENL